MLADKLGILTTSYKIGEVSKTLEKAEKIAFDWEANNPITYHINTIEVSLFSKTQHKKLATKWVEIQLGFKKQTIFFNKKSSVG